MSYNVAVVGATGLVGQTFIELLEKRNFPVKNLYPFASERSKNRKIIFKNREINLLTAENILDYKYDIAFFSAGSSVSLIQSGLFVKQGALVIDNSSAFRMEKNVPLVVPEINGRLIKNHNGIIANPNCSTIQMVMVLAPLMKLSPVKRVVVTTFQSVSGSGTKAVNELKKEMKEFINGDAFSEPEVYPWRIFNNSLPHIDRFLENGYTFEEEKMIKETQKILEEEISVTATCVRVPVFQCHSESINIEFKNEINLNEIVEALEKFPGVVVTDNPEKNIYPLQGDLKGTTDVHVGRIREDNSLKNSINLWCSTDNILKGAALNGIQIAEFFCNK